MIIKYSCRKQPHSSQQHNNAPLLIKYLSTDKVDFRFNFPSEPPYYSKKRKKIALTPLPLDVSGHARIFFFYIYLPSSANMTTNMTENNAHPHPQRHYIIFAHPNFNPSLVHYLWLSSVYVISLKSALGTKHCVRENKFYVKHPDFCFKIYIYIYIYFVFETSKLWHGIKNYTFFSFRNVALLNPPPLLNVTAIKNKTFLCGFP